jgi:hypothetical protein
MPPWKPVNLYPVGSTVDNLHWFLDHLFDAGQQAFRDQFFMLGNEAQLRDLLATNKIFIPATDPQTGNPIRLMIVDVEYARCHHYDAPIVPARDLFYLLVMPPVPRYYDPVMQNWESAWYHAIVDGYGM